jgi:hypothetical protein
MDRVRSGEGHPSSVRVGDRVGGEHLEEPLEVALDGRVEEPPRELLLPRA